MKNAESSQSKDDLSTRMEELDHVLRVVRPRTWIALGTVGMLVALAMVWGFTGRVSTLTTGQGILLKSGVLFPVVAAHPGQIQSIEVEPGQQILQNDILAHLDQPLLQSELREAQTLLDKLLQDKAVLERYEQEHDKLLKQNLEKKRETLRTSIRIGRELVKRQESLVATIEALAERGVASVLDMEKQRAVLHQAQIRLLENEQELVGVDVEEDQLNYEVNQRLSDLMQTMLPVQERTISLQEQLETHSVVRSPHAGKVVELHKNRGDMLREGESVVLLELNAVEGHSLTADDTLVVAYVASFKGMELRPGMAAHVIPETVREEEYGVMLGDVAFISPYPVSHKGMMRILGNEEWVQELAREGAPTMVTIRLQKDKKTASGYRWSSGKGPPGTVKTGAKCVVRIIARRRAPIDLVVPEMKRRLFGVGEGTY